MEGKTFLLASTGARAAFSSTSPNDNVALAIFCVPEAGCYLTRRYRPPFLVPDKV